MGKSLGLARDYDVFQHVVVASNSGAYSTNQMASIQGAVGSNSTTGARASSSDKAVRDAKHKIHLDICSVLQGRQVKWASWLTANYDFPPDPVSIAVFVEHAPGRCMNNYLYPTKGNSEALTDGQIRCKIPAETR